LIPLLCSILFGIVGIWLMLPPSGPRRRRIGAVSAAVALGLLGYLLPPLGDKVQQAIFWVLAGLTSAGGLATISSRNPVYCAIWFALTLLTTAGLFLLQGAQFLGVATVVVYAGAILVTFLFVLMLAQPAGHDFYDRISWGPAVTFFAAIAGVLIVGGLTYILTHDDLSTEQTKVTAQQPVEDLTSAKLRQQNEHHMASIGGELFTKHLVSVEVVGTLLLVALVGAIAIVIQGKQNPSGDYGNETGGPNDVG
jgi:NADH-quinone oxidoreductase subunit J